MKKLFKMTGLAVALASTTGIANAADTIGFVDQAMYYKTTLYY